MTGSSLKRTASPQAPPAAHNLHGQRLGRKGSKTRERLIDSARALIAIRALRTIRVAEIAERANVSTTTFYKYFESVEDAVLAAIAKHAQIGPDIVAALDVEWPAGSVRAHAAAFVRVYLAYWDRNFSLLRVRNLAADEGDQRFVRARLDSIEPALSRLEQKVAAAQKSGRVPKDVHPGAAAGFLMSSLERLVAGTRQEGRQSTRYTRARLIEAAGFIIAAALGDEL